MPEVQKLTPMMEQWHAQRAKLSHDTLLLFRLGDFYEIFEQDAVEGSKILGITLTKRHGMPMAGIPYHAAESYINKILQAGKKVAICDQVETPKAGKLVKRELTRILTPGTTLEGQQLQEDRNHFLLSLHFVDSGLAGAWLDLSTGTFELAWQPLHSARRLIDLVAACDPREIVLSNRFQELLRNTEQFELLREEVGFLLEHRPLTEIEDYHFERSTGAATLHQTLGVLNLDGFGIPEDHPAIGPAGALVHYASENLCAPPENLAVLREHRLEDCLLLDPSTQRNLEVFQVEGGSRKGSLLSAMNGTLTAGGARLLERILAAPPLDCGEIRRRQAAVGGFVRQPSLTHELREKLRLVRDLSRILSRLQNRIRNPRELGGIRDTLRELPAIALTLSQFRAPELGALAGRIGDFSELSGLLSRSLQDELPGNILDGGTIRIGYDSELDRLHGLTRDNKTWLADLEASEQKRTGIRNLKVRYNGAFGYFIEVTKSNLNLVPDDYIRKQTMVNAERFYTESLKEKEKEILTAEERSLAREEVLFRELIQEVLLQADSLRTTAGALAEADLFSGWAVIAREWGYCEPVVDDSPEIAITGGRHPVVEQMMKQERLGLAGTHSFVPNDTTLRCDDAQIALITGPNMAGKSTYIRQVALITLMAHAGSWVPAQSCRIGRVDRIFSRVGASDQLSRGNSTFMVEMTETANILHNATERSLIILDEIGRGTSTYDGLSIAWAVVEHLHGKQDSGPRTLFATHYHELTRLAQVLPRVRNFSVAVKEWNEEIIFVRQVVPGAADRSYGIQVARLAGIPKPVIQRAQVILDRLESDDSSSNLLPRSTSRTRRNADRAGPVGRSQSELDDQLELF